VKLKRTALGFAPVAYCFCRVPWISVVTWSGDVFRLYGDVRSLLFWGLFHEKQLRKARASSCL